MIRNEAPDQGHLNAPDGLAVTRERIGGMDTREFLLPQVGYTCGGFGERDLGMSRRLLPRYASTISSFRLARNATTSSRSCGGTFSAAMVSALWLISNDQSPSLIPMPMCTSFMSRPV